MSTWFDLDDKEWGLIEPLLPQGLRGARRTNDWRGRKNFSGCQPVPPLFASEGSDPDLTLIISLENFAKILSGEQDPNLAFMMGKLKIQGSLGIALKLNSILES